MVALKEAILQMMGARLGSSLRNMHLFGRCID